MTLKSSISLGEYERRIAKAREYMAEHHLDGFCIFGAMRIFYFSGFHHLPTERPVVLVIPLRGNLALLVPCLEEENIPIRTPHIKEIKVYREYPGPRHPMHYLIDLLGDKGLLDKKFGVDATGWGGGWGYQGPSLAELAPDADLVNVRDVIDDMRMTKSEEELELIRLSAHFGNVAHGLLQDNIKVGQSEAEVSLRTTLEMTKYVIKALGTDWEPMGRGEGVSVSFTSGPKTSFNHRSTGARTVRSGDVILTESSPFIGGYCSELERMLIVGTPSDEQKKYFDLEVAAQNVAFDAIRPGAQCCDVERAVNAFLEQHNLYCLTRTHIGHSIGMEGHERPFLDVGDSTVIKPGMLLTVEPCLFLPGIAGFRHSDTVAVTEDGLEMITYYPRDIENLTVAA